jgi:recombination protein RecT
MSTEIQKNPIKDYMNNPKVQEKFNEILGQNSTNYITSVMQVVSSNNMLAQAEPSSVFQSAALAAVLNLPINNNIGYAYIVPYKQSYQEGGQWKSKIVAQFQIGWKGLVQLAIRSGSYKTISVTEIYEGQLKSNNPLTGFEFDFSKPSKGTIIGYASYFSLTNGFEKILYATVAQIQEHGKKFSKTYENTTSPWKTSFDSMAKKTILKGLISKFGPMSLEMQKSINADQGVVEDFETGQIKYPDNPNEAPDSVLEVNASVVDEFQDDIVE